MAVQVKLSGVKQLSNTSLTSIVEFTNFNINLIASAVQDFLRSINYVEGEDEVSVEIASIDSDVVQIKQKLSVLGTQLNNSGTYDEVIRLEPSGSVIAKNVLANDVLQGLRVRLKVFGQVPPVGVPGEIIYIQEQPGYEEGFYGYLISRGWVCLSCGDNGPGGASNNCCCNKENIIYTNSGNTTGNGALITNNLSLGLVPALGTGFMFFINGQQIEIGDGTKNAPVYLSDDNGANALNFYQASPNSKFYWNSSYGGFDLDTTDRITMRYIAIDPTCGTGTTTTSTTMAPISTTTTTAGPSTTTTTVFVTSTTIPCAADTIVHIVDPSNPTTRVTFTGTPIGPFQVQFTDAYGTVHYLTTLGNIIMPWVFDLSNPYYASVPTINGVYRFTDVATGCVYVKQVGPSTTTTSTSTTSTSTSTTTTTSTTIGTTTTTSTTTTSTTAPPPTSTSTSTTSTSTSTTSTTSTTAPPPTSTTSTSTSTTSTTSGMVDGLQIRVSTDFSFGTPNQVTIWYAFKASYDVTQPYPLGLTWTQLGTAGTAALCNSYSVFGHIENPPVGSIYIQARSADGTKLYSTNAINTGTACAGGGATLYTQGYGYPGGSLLAAFLHLRIQNASLVDAPPLSTTTTTSTSTTSTTALTTTTTTETPVDVLLGSDPTVEIWYDSTWAQAFQAGTVNGSYITQWNDRSSTAHDANTNGSIQVRPTYLTNAQCGLPVVTWDGDNDLFTVNPLISIANKPGAAMAMAFRIQSTLDQVITVMQANGGGEIYDMHVGVTNNRLQIGMANAVATIDNYTVDSDFHIIELYFDGSLSTFSRIQVFLDGVQRTLTYSANPIFPTTNANSTTLLIGTDTNGQKDFNGQIGEIAMYSRVLTVSEKVNLRNYLIAKWFCNQTTTTTSTSTSTTSTTTTAAPPPTSTTTLGTTTTSTSTTTAAPPPTSTTTSTSTTSTSTTSTTAAASYSASPVSLGYSPFGVCPCETSAVFYFDNAAMLYSGSAQLCQATLIKSSVFAAVSPGTVMRVGSGYGSQTDYVYREVVTNGTNIGQFVSGCLECICGPYVCETGCEYFAVTGLTQDTDPGSSPNSVLVQYFDCTINQLNSYLVPVGETVNICACTNIPNNIIPIWGGTISIASLGECPVSTTTTSTTSTTTTSTTTTTTESPTTTTTTVDEPCNCTSYIITDLAGAGDSTIGYTDCNTGVSMTARPGDYGLQSFNEAQSVTICSQTYPSFGFLATVTPNGECCGSPNQVVIVPLSTTTSTTTAAPATTTTTTAAPTTSTTTTTQPTTTTTTSAMNTTTTTVLNCTPQNCLEITVLTQDNPTVIQYVDCTGQMQQANVNPNSQYTFCYCEDGGWAAIAGDAAIINGPVPCSIEATTTTTTIAEVAPTTTTTTVTCEDCYQYTVDPAEVPVSVQWINCDGAAGEAYLVESGQFNIACARNDSVIVISGTASVVRGEMCGNTCQSSQTTTTTTTNPCVGYTLDSGVGSASIEWMDCNGIYSTYTFTGQHSICTDGSGYTVTEGSVTANITGPCA